MSECYDCGDDVTVEYDHAKGGYTLVKQEQEFLTNNEILAISKVLLESRGFNKEELNRLLDKLLIQATPSARINIKELIQKERFHYIPPRHGKNLFETIWDISTAISNQEKLCIDYTKMNGSVTSVKIEPLAVTTYIDIQLYFSID